MSDYFEPENIVKSYDSDIMKRLLGYLKPYMLIFVLSLIALAVSTVGELYVPILLQRATDNHILPYYRALRVDRIPPDVLELLVTTFHELRSGRDAEGVAVSPTSSPVSTAEAVAVGVGVGPICNGWNQSGSWTRI